MSQSRNLEQENQVWGMESIYLHHSAPLLQNNLDRPENRCGRYCARGSAERIWGEFFIWSSEFFVKFAGEFLSVISWCFFLQIFRPCFSRISGPPPKKKSGPKFTSRIVGIPLQFHFLNPKLIHTDFLLAGEINRYGFARAGLSL